MAAKLDFKRATNGQQLDIYHLQTLSAEATPIIIKTLSYDNSGVFVEKPSTQTYCETWVNTNEASNSVTNDLYTRWNLMYFLNLENYSSDREKEAIDWRDWNYSRMRANDLLPAPVPNWLEVPNLINSYDEICAPFVTDTQPTGIVPSERIR
jgi:hypothetical protein